MPVFPISLDDNLVIGQEKIAGPWANVCLLDEVQSFSKQRVSKLIFDIGRLLHCWTGLAPAKRGWDAVTFLGIGAAIPRR